MKELWCLEHSQYSEDRGMYPFHVCLFDEAVRTNVQDYHHNNRGENKWQVIFTGSPDECTQLCNELILDKVKKINPILKDFLLGQV